MEDRGMEQNVTGMEDVGGVAEPRCLGRCTFLVAILVLEHEIFRFAVQFASTKDRCLLELVDGGLE
jgi:hypothetical protein